jgi:hypothetical protein
MTERLTLLSFQLRQTRVPGGSGEFVHPEILCHGGRSACGTVAEVDEDSSGIPMVSPASNSGSMGIDGFAITIGPYKVGSP